MTVLASNLTSPIWSNSPADLAVAVGEASGDWIAALAIQQLIEQHPHGLRIEGIAGPQLRQLGVSPLHQSEELSVRGYVEVLRHLPRLLRMRKQLKHRWSTTHRPKVLLGVDAPDFNLNLELAVRQSGVPTVHLVCPSIWAWRFERIHKLKAACDHVLCIFPFEPEILAKEGIEATYVGHPMACIIPLQVDQALYAQTLNLSTQHLTLAVLPGSRAAEVKHIAPAMIAAVALLRKKIPGLQVVTPLPNAALIAQFKAMLGPDLLSTWTVLEGRSHEVMGASDAVLLASGTATLEAMMFKKPMVIAYKMPWLSYQLMKGKGYMPYVGLPNILLQEFAVPELIQDAAHPQALADATYIQLTSESNRIRLHRLFEAQHHLLRQPSGQLSADVLGRYVQH